MNGSDRVVTTRSQQLLLVRLTGAVDDAFPAGQLAAALASTGDPIVVDFNEVTRVTSYGVREWIGAIKAGSGPVFFVNCRPAVVVQLNMIPAFRGRAVVVSLYCPFVCPTCDAGFEVLADLRKDVHLTRGEDPAAVACPKCGASAEFDDVPAAYFRCIIGKPLPGLPAAVLGFLDGGSAQLAPLVQQDLAADLTVLWLSGQFDAASKLKRHVEGLEGTVLCVMADARASGSDGIGALAVLLRAPTAKLLLARVDAALAVELLDAGLLAGVALLSVRADAMCVHCGVASSVEVRGGEPSGATSGHPCPACGTPTSLRLTDAAAAGIARLPLAAAPKAAATYLADHPTFEPAPEFDATREVHSWIGKYEIVKEIGNGGMAQVLLGLQAGAGGFKKQVVVKRILPHLATRAEFAQQFIEEARVASRLNSPHIVQIYDLAQEGKDFIIVMEFVDGYDLQRLIQMTRRLGERIPVEIAARIVADTASGLHVAHTYVDPQGVAQPVVHRDVSPHNILVGRDGGVKLTDFGVAKAADSLHQTEAGLLKGKVLYMAPEVVLGLPFDGRVDIFALGLTLYYALARVHPFHQPTEVASLRAVLDARIPRVSEVTEIPAALDAIIARATERRPEDRYQTAQEFGAALNTFVAGLDVPADTGAVASWVQGISARLDAAPAAPLDDATEAADLARTVATPLTQRATTSEPKSRSKLPE